jgi:hypothetical protein
MIRNLVALSLLLASSACFSQKTVSPDTAAMMKRIVFFASPENAGRLPGHTGYNNCSKFAADYFEELKFFPFSGKTWYQHFNIEMNEINSLSFSLILDNKKNELVPGSEYSCRGFTGSGECKSEIVFCGYGLSQPDDGYDDYAGVDVKGKTVMVFKQNPGWQIKGIHWQGSEIRYKVSVAKEQGACAVIFVNAPSSGRTKPIASQLDGERDHIADMPALEISTEKANMVLEVKGKTLTDLQAKTDTLQIPQSFNTGVNAEIKVNATYTPEAATQNVIACIPGSDPVLKNEYVLVTAHLDHVGFQGKDLYYPGANDNASGSAIVMEVASMWRKSKIKPARTVVFVLFSCEEHGLDGAKFLANNFPGDIQKAVAILNIDCAGHGDSLMAGGGKSVPALWQNAADFGKGKPMSNRTWHGGGADAQPFFEKGVPALYFATVNSYTYLHLPGDKPETLNPKMLELTADIVFKTSVKVASRDYVKENIVAP